MKRIISLLLCFVTFLSIMSSFSTNVFAYSSPSPFDVAGAENKAYELLSVLGGDGAYFTCNRSYCSKPRESGHACNNCFTTNIVQKTWFTNLFGSVSTAQFPEQYYPSGGTGTPAGWSCHGFANFAMWYIFKTNTTDKVTSKKIGIYYMTKANFDSYVWPGDVIRTSAGHSMVVLSWDSSGFKVIDSNWTGPNCEVHIGTRSFSSSTKFAISRAQNATKTGSVVVSHSISSSYSKNFTAYLKNPSTNHYVFNEAHSNTGAYVNDVDPVTIYEVYTDGCCKFQYITSAGAYKTAYGKIDWFCWDTHSVSSSYSKNFTAYLKNPSTNHYVFDANHSQTGGYVNDVDPVTIYEVYTDGCCKFQYITSAGAYRTAYGKIEWFTWNEHKVNTNYPKNYTAYLKNPNTNHYVFNEAHSNTGGYVNDVDPVTIYEVYTDGCCKFQYITSAGAYRTAYGKIEWFEHTHSYTEHYEEAHPHKIFKKCYCGDWYYTGATKNISSCSLCNPAKYTVHYDSNGGTGAPADQTKTHNVDLTLSSTQPTRSATITLNPNGGSVSPTSKAVSYVFNGWNEEIGGTGANYTSGGTYQTNAAVTLYAQWQNPSAYTLPKPEKSGYICTGWNTKADGSGTAYAVGAKYTATKNVTLYAQWTEDTVSGIKVKSEPTKLTYFKGETLDTTGLVVAAIYVSDKIENVSSGFTCNPTTLNNVGTQKITVTYGGKSTSFDVTVKDDTLSSVAIKTKPSKITYYKGETLITSGLTLTATYASGKTQTVSSGFNCNPTTLNTVGTQKITVTYGGKTTSFDVTVKDDTLSSVAIRTLPTKLTYYKGETLNTSGLTLTATYASGKTQTVSSGFNYTPSVLNTAGTQEIAVSYNGKGTYFNVNVIEDYVVGIYVKTQPNKTVYYKGDTLDTLGLTIIAKYASGKEERVNSGFTCSPTKLNSTGTQTITVSYMGFTTDFEITVKPLTVTGIAIRTTPAKTDYYVGDALNTAGLTLTVFYDNGSQKAISSGFNCTPMTFSTVGTQTITVTYGGSIATFAVNVSAVPASSHTITFVVDGRTYSTAVYKTGEGIQLPTEPVKPGYKFRNWNPLVPASMPDEDITVEAVFNPIKYNAVFTADSTTVAVIPYTVETSNITEPAVPSKNGYNGKWSAYSLDEGGVTVYAVYTPKTFTVPVVADGRKIAETTYTYGDTELVNLPAVPEKAGYTGKWEYNLTSDGAQANAIYTAVTYYATFTADGRKVGERIPFTVETRSINEPDVPSKSGYTGRWNAYTLAANDITVTAVYELINTPAEPSGRPATVSIRNFRSTVTEDYKSTLTFTAVTSDIPEGATIHWIINGKDMGTGETYTVERATSDYNVQIKVVGADGSTVAESETETVKIRSGFLEMLIAFFRQLLGSLPENKQ